MRQCALVRPNTFGDVASRIRTGNALAVPAAIRNIVTTAPCLSGADNIAVTQRAATRDPPPPRSATSGAWLGGGR